MPLLGYQTKLLVFPRFLLCKQGSPIRSWSRPPNFSFGKQTLAGPPWRKQSRNHCEASLGNKLEASGRSPEVIRGTSRNPQKGYAAPAFTIRMRWSVNLKCAPGNSTFGMWQLTHRWFPTGHDLWTVRGAERFRFSGALASGCFASEGAWQVVHAES